MAKNGGDGDKPPKKPRRRAPNQKGNVINLKEAKRQLGNRPRKGGGETVPPATSPSTQAGAHAGKRKAGRPQHEPTEESRAIVAGLRAAGASIEVICANLGIAKDTLKRHYSVEMETGFEVTAALAVGNITKLLRSGDFKATRFWLETHMGWGKRLPRNMGPSVLNHVEAFEAAPVVGIVGPGEGSEPGRFGMGDAVPPPPNAQGRIPIVMRIGLEQKDIQTKDKVKEGEDQ